MIKKILAISLIAISTLLLLLSILLSLADYDKVKSESVALIQERIGARAQIGEVVIKRFPIPQIILSNVEISNLLTADTITFDYSLMSLLKANPKVSNIHIHSDSYDAHIKSEYKNGIYTCSEGTVTIYDTTALLSNYKDLSYQFISAIDNTALNASFDIQFTNNSLTLTNISATILGSTGKGEVVLTTNNSNLPSTFNIVFDKLSIIGEQLSNLNIAGSITTQSMTFNDLSATFDDGGNFTLNGDLTRNAYRSLFHGTLKLNHKDVNAILNKGGLSNLATNVPMPITIDSKIVLTPVEVTLTDSKNLLDNVQILGDISMKYIADTPRLNLNLNINNLDLGIKYPVISAIMDYMQSFAYDMKASDYITKFIPIIIPPCFTNFTLALSNTKFMDTVLDKLIITGNLEPNNLIFQNLSYTSGKNSLSANASITTDSIKPNIQLNITKGILSLNDISANDILEKLLYIQRDMDFSKATTSINVSLDQLNINNPEYQLDNVIFQTTASGSDNNFSDIHFNSKFGESEIVVNGTVSCIDPLMFNLAYAYNNFDINNLLQFTPSGLSIQGNLSTNGTLSTHGNVMKDLLYNAYLSSNFITPSIKVSHYNIENFVTKIAALNYNSHNLEADISNITQENIYSPLKDLIGRYSMEKGIITVKDSTFFTEHSSGALSVVYNIYTNDFALSETASFVVPLNMRQSSPSSIIFDIQKHGQNSSINVDSTQLEKTLATRKPVTIETK